MPKVRKEPRAKSARMATGPDGDADGFVQRGGEKPQLELQQVDTTRRDASDGGAGAGSSSVVLSAEAVEAQARVDIDPQSRSPSAAPAASASAGDGAEARPDFAPLGAKAAAAAGGGPRETEFRRVRVPSHRYTPLRQQWPTVMKPLVEYLRLQVRMNVKTRSVELKTSAHTADVGALQKGADFVQAFMLGF